MLIIDKRGNRQPYFAATQELFANPGGQMGDLSNCAAWMSAVGHHVYSICDSDFPTTVFEKNVLTDEGTDRNRIPITDPSTLIDTKGLVSADWLAEVDEAVERGAVKKADTIEELADMLLLDRDVLVRAVKEYNELCEKGVDDEMSTPYDPSWLHPVVKAAVLRGHHRQPDGEDDVRPAHRRASAGHARGRLAHRVCTPTPPRQAACRARRTTVASGIRRCSAAWAPAGSPGGSRRSRCWTPSRVASRVGSASGAPRSAPHAVADEATSLSASGFASVSR